MLVLIKGAGDLAIGVANRLKKWFWYCYDWNRWTDYS